MADPRVPPPPPPARRAAPPPTNAPAAAPSGNGTFVVSSGKVARGPQRVVIYGPGGIGKSTLAALAPNPVFLDLEMGTRDLEVKRVDGVESFADVRACLQSSVLTDFTSIVLDTATRLEELAVAHTLANVPTERGEYVMSIEGYGFGKGLQHVYDTFLLLLQDLDRHVREGRNIVLLCHECTADVPNPVGENYIRFEPRLQAPKSGKASIRNRVVEWADHVLFVGYDVAATKTGKGIGGGTRTIWPSERPDHIAKSRTLPDSPMPYTGPEDGAVWAAIFGDSL